MKWSEWFNANKDELAELLKSDAEEALFRAYLAGIESMGESMGNTVKNLYR